MPIFLALALCTAAVSFLDAHQLQALSSPPFLPPGAGFAALCSVAGILSAVLWRLQRTAR